MHLNKFIRKQLRNGKRKLKKVLFVCVENAGRSQMTEAFAKYYGKDKIQAISTHTTPSCA